MCFQFFEAAEVRAKPYAFLGIKHSISCFRNREKYFRRIEMCTTASWILSHSKRSTLCTLYTIRVCAFVCVPWFERVFVAGSRKNVKDEKINRNKKTTLTLVEARALYQHITYIFQGISGALRRDSLLVSGNTTLVHPHNGTTPVPSTPPLQKRHILSS